MLNNTMGVLFASDNEGNLGELTIHRTTASLPYGGRYRLIDFALSNFVNCGITNIAIVTRNNYNSLMDHIRMGRDWNLNRKNSGITIFPPYVLNTLHEVYRGKVEALFSILNFINNNKSEYVVIANSNIVCNIDMEEIVEKHIAEGADITVLTHMSKDINARKTLITTDKTGLITDLKFALGSDRREQLVNMNIYILRKDLLTNLVESAYARGLVDFEKDIILKKLNEIKIMSHEVKSYAVTIDDIPSYYCHSMDLLKADVREDVFYSNGSIYTKVKDSVPTRYIMGAAVKNSLIADGCVIDGEVENSILFRGVRVEKGAVVKNSILMEKTSVCENAQVSYTITDKSVTINNGRHLSGYESYPIVVAKNKVV